MFGQASVEIPTAILAGLLSFVSPCVLPLIPGYLSFISGVSVEDLMAREKTGSNYGKLLVNTIFFVVGFSAVFVLLGLGASSIGTFLQRHMGIFNKIAGVVVFLFGLHVTGLLRIKALNYEKRFHMTGEKKRGILGSAVIGIASGSAGPRVSAPSSAASSSLPRNRAHSPRAPCCWWRTPPVSACHSF